MAIYTYQCGGCGALGEVWQSISSYYIRPNRPSCCGQEMERYLTAPLVAVDHVPFVSPIDGTVINSKSARREHMIKHGVVPTDEIMPDIHRNRKAMLQSFKADIKEDIFKAEAMVAQGYKPSLDVGTLDNVIPAS